ncbi:hypothetical protein JOQ06_000215, partial [Pogonophryne albipinna]
AALQSHSKKVCGFGGENKQPPHFILPRLGRSSLLLSTPSDPPIPKKSTHKTRYFGEIMSSTSTWPFGVSELTGDGPWRCKTLKTADSLVGETFGGGEIACRSTLTSEQL